MILFADVFQSVLFQSFYSTMNSVRFSSLDAQFRQRLLDVSFCCECIWAFPRWQIQLLIRFGYLSHGCASQNLLFRNNNGISVNVIVQNVPAKAVVVVDTLHVQCAVWIVVGCFFIYPIFFAIKSKLILYQPLLDIIIIIQCMMFSHMPVSSLPYITNISRFVSFVFGTCSACEQLSEFRSVYALFFVDFL